MSAHIWPVIDWGVSVLGILAAGAGIAAGTFLVFIPVAHFVDFVARKFP